MACCPDIALLYDHIRDYRLLEGDEEPGLLLKAQDVSDI